MKKILTSILCICIAMCMFTSCTFYDGTFEKNTDERNDESRDTEKQTKFSENKDETDISSKDESFADIPYIEDTYPQMMKADFWQNGNDKVLIDKSGIEKINNENEPKICFTDENGNERNISIYGEQKIPGKDVKLAIDLDKLPQSGESAYTNGKPNNKAYWDGLCANRNLDAVPENVSIRYAVCVMRSSAYCFPTEDFITDKADDIYYNNNVQSEVFIGEELAVLHESADGKWCYAIFGSFGGWIKKEDIAFCRDRDEWDRARNPEKFLVVTGNKVLADGTPGYASDVPATVFDMGTKIRLADGNAKSLYGRGTYAAYTAEIPERDGNGELTWKKILIPVSRDVSEGYIPLTSDNIIELAFKFLGQIYGWGGSFGSNDCSGMVRQIFNCFGIKMPRNSSQIIAMNGFERIKLDGLKDTEKYEEISGLEPGSLLYYPGHLMLYLGNYEDKAYVISSCGMFAHKGEAGKDKVVFDYVNEVLVTPLNVVGKHGLTWQNKMTQSLNLKIK